MPLEANRRAVRAAEAGAGSAEQALAAAGLGGRNVEVLLFEEATCEVFAPGFLVALDWDLHAVVVAFRGTACLSDCLTDLACESASVQLLGATGHAHRGMLMAARRLESRVFSSVSSGIARLCAAGHAVRLRICGHSLGAGVASLLTALWLAARRFPDIELHCYAFASPQVLDGRLAARLAADATSLVVGDDIVPRFSLATALDLRSAMLLLRDPEANCLPAEFRAAEILS